MSSWCVGRAVCAAALGCLSCASGGFCLSVRVVGERKGDGIFARHQALVEIASTSFSGASLSFPPCDRRRQGPSFFLLAGATCSSFVASEPARLLHPLQSRRT